VRGPVYLIRRGRIVESMVGERVGMRTLTVVLFLSSTVQLARYMNGCRELTCGKRCSSFSADEFDSSLGGTQRFRFAIVTG
jgi:hypothetical protein